MNKSITSLSEQSKSFLIIPLAFPRVLNKQEVFSLDVTYAVLYAVKDPRDMWDSFKNIFWYVYNNIRYAHDQPQLFVQPILITYEGEAWVTDMSIQTFNNYIQTPTETLKFKHGDCED